MLFAIHQSRLDPRIYVFTKRRDDFSDLPEGLLEQLGKIQFLRTARSIQDETEKIVPWYKEIEGNVNVKGYHILKIG
jgi:uncharacterized protein